MIQFPLRRPDAEFPAGGPAMDRGYRRGMPCGIDAAGTQWLYRDGVWCDDGIMRDVWDLQACCDKPDLSTVVKADRYERAECCRCGATVYDNGGDVSIVAAKTMRRAQAAWNDANRGPFGDDVTDGAS